MKILVAVKRVIDPYVKIRVKADGSGVETQNMKMSMNPFDEIAVEEALRIQEAQQAEEVILLSIGDDIAQETLRHGLALGADRAILAKTEQSYEPLNIAKIIAAVVDKEKPDLILMGKQTIDGDNNQTPQMLAALLDWPQATYASKINLEDGKAVVVREIDGGLETIEVTLPAVMSSDLRLNEPRYASLPNIMKAKRKPLDVIAVEDMGLGLSQHVEVLGVRAPDTRNSGVKLDSVDALLDKLQNEAKVL
jgi:electron transfer flavoprotein beta subunit